MLNVFIQARMSSERLPEKVLKPIYGKPMIQVVVEQVSKAIPLNSIVVLTSTEQSDDALAAFLADNGINCFRGSLDNVLDRFQQAAKVYPSSHILRISADSPLMSPDVITYAKSLISDEWDLITNVKPRSFPKGHSVELVKTSTLLAIDQSALTDHEKEHVMPHIYAHPDRYAILNFHSGQEDLAEINLCVDTPDDYERLSKMIDLPYTLKDLTIQTQQVTDV